MNSSELFLKELAPEILITLRRNKLQEIYKNNLAKKTGRNKSHVVRKTNILEEKGYIKTQKDGRKQIITLTEKGEKTAEKLEQLTQITK